MNEKSSCPVLRGRDGGNTILLLDNLSEADLSKADLSEADLWQADLKEARSLQKADLHGVKGQTEEQLEACKARGAII